MKGTKLQLRILSLQGSYSDLTVEFKVLQTKHTLKEFSNTKKALLQIKKRNFSRGKKEKATARIRQTLKAEIKKGHW